MLVGRDREVEALEAALEALVAATGGLFLIAGEPGIGKSRLAGEVTQRAKARGLRVSYGQCWEAGGAPALWPWREALEGLGTTFPESRALSTTEPTEARFALFRDVIATLSRAATSGPAVIVLEDLHAADHSTLLLLEHVATGLRTLPVLVIGTFRELEASLRPETSASLGRAGRSARLLQLGRLGAIEVAALVHEGIANADDALAAKVFETTAGNPLFVGEIVRDWRARGPSEQIPLGVREVIRQRLGLITPETRRVLECAAVFGVEVDASDLARIERDAAAVLDEAQRGGLVIAHGHRSRFTHALYREALYHDLPRARRHELHRHAARSIAARSGPLSEIAHHLLEAGPEAAVLAIDHATRAAHQAAAVFAFEDASALLERARQAIPAGPDQARLGGRVRIAQGQLAIRSGDAGGRAICVEVAQLARTLGDPELLAHAGLAYGAVFLMGGVDPVLVGMLDEALAGLTTETPLRARAMARLAAARQPSKPAERPRDIELAFAAVELARRVAEPRELLEVLHAASGVTYGAVEPAIRIQMAREQERIAEQLGDVTLLLHARTRLAFDHLELGDFAAHAQLADTYERHAETIGPAAAPWRVPLMRSMQAIARDDFAASEQLQAEARRLEHGQPRARRALAFHRICFLRAAERHAELRAAIPELRGLWLEMPYGVAIAEARVAAMLARLGAEDELLALLATVPEAMFDEEINAVSLVDAVWLTGDARHAKKLEAHFASRAERWMAYWFDCEIADIPNTRHTAYLAAISGRWEDCERAFARALIAVEAVGRRSMAARMRFELGDLMLRLDHAPERARALIAEGRAGAAACGLTDLMTLIDRRHPTATPTQVSPPTPVTHLPFAMVLEGEYYAVATARGTLRFKSSRGMQYLARLVDRPNIDIHVLELVGSSELPDRGDAGELLDPAAFRAYKARLETLRDRLSDAEEINDAQRAETIRTEMESIAAELSSTTGKGGKARRAENPIDRARSAVQRRIKDALDRIAEQDADLGKQLRRAVRTGNYCSYRDTD